MVPRQFGLKPEPSGHHDLIRTSRPAQGILLVASTLPSSALNAGGPWV